MADVVALIILVACLMTFLIIASEDFSWYEYQYFDYF